MSALGLYWTPEDLRKITSDILAGKRVTDTDVCILIEAGPYDRVKACIDAHWSTYYPSTGNYSNSITLKEILFFTTILVIVFFTPKS